MMGFNLDVAEFGAAKVNYRSVDAALGYLTDKDEVNNLYVHEFVPFGDDLCFIC